MLFALINYFIKHDRTGAWILGVGVVSHWILDFVTHRPDLPIIPGLTMYAGLGLWNSFLGCSIVEGTLFATGVIVYARFVPSTDWIGKVAFWLLIFTFFAIWLGAMLSGPPPNETVLALAGLTSWLFIPWGYWIDKHRRPAVRVTAYQ
jgi:hypothetical protein